MLNDKNLVPFSNRSESEARENGRKGGKKSGETRRRKKALKSLMNDLLSSGIVNDDIYNMTVDMGFGADPTYGAGSSRGDGTAGGARGHQGVQCDRSTLSARAAPGSA